MHFVLVTTGSMGDVKPFLALAKGLMQAGHSVRLAGPEDARQSCQALGVDFSPIDGNHGERLRSTESDRLERGNTLYFGYHRLREKRKLLLEVNQAAWRACQDAEAIVYRIGGFLAADSIAERLGVPCFKAGLVPYTPTRDFPSLYAYRGLDYGSIGNRMSYTLIEQAIWQYFRGEINSFREDVLGLKGYPFAGPGNGAFTNSLPVLYGFSPAILPRPEDWPDRVQITGHWALKEENGWQPPKKLEEFLAAGSKPVYIGFGSMVTGDTQTMFNLIVEAMRICGRRAVVVGAFLESRNPEVHSDLIYEIDWIPHDWIFSRVALAVHHGGIGTTTASLKAGLPTAIVPFNYDQPFWGSVVERLGVGPAPMTKKKMTAGWLAQAIQDILKDQDMQARAREVGEQIQNERGIYMAIRYIHYLLM